MNIKFTVELIAKYCCVVLLVHFAVRIKPMLSLFVVFVFLLHIVSTCSHEPEESSYTGLRGCPEGAPGEDGYEILINNPTFIVVCYEEPDGCTFRDSDLDLPGCMQTVHAIGVSVLPVDVVYERIRFTSAAYMRLFLGDCNIVAKYHCAGGICL